MKKQYVVKILGELGLGFTEEHYHELDETMNENTLCKVCSNNGIIFIVPKDRFELAEVGDKDEQSTLDSQPE